MLMIRLFYFKGISRSNNNFWTNAHSKSIVIFDLQRKKNNWRITSKESLYSKSRSRPKY